MLTVKYEERRIPEIFERPFASSPSHNDIYFHFLWDLLDQV